MLRYFNRPFIYLLSLTVLFQGPVLSQPAKKHPRRPNIIIILADDLGYGETGCYGQRIIRTPNIDRLARDGMKFIAFYAGSAVCVPSRCCLLTGLHTGHSQIRDNKDLDQSEYPCQLPLEKNTFTIARMLKQTGYHTACIGKWGLGGQGSTGIPEEQGFDFFFGFLSQEQASNHYPSWLWRNTEKVLLGNPTIPLHQKLSGNQEDAASYKKYTGTEFSEDILTEEAIDFIRQQKDSSFFLYLSFTLPHLALQVPEKSVQEYVSLKNDKPYTGLSGYLPCRYPHATYAGMISALDDKVGKIAGALETLHLDSNTLVIFTSDNGSSTTSGGADPVFFDSHGNLRAGKGSLYEGGIRVPCIIAWPGKIKGSSVCEQPFASWDLLPTLAQLAGIREVPRTDGISFVPSLLDQKNQAVHDFLYWEFPGSGGQQAVRSGKWKAIRRNVKENSLRKFELYDLSADPGESVNLAESYPEIVQKMKEYARKRIPSTRPEWNFVRN